MVTRGKRKPADARAKLEQAAAIEALESRVGQLTDRVEALESNRTYFGVICFSGCDRNGDLLTSRKTGGGSWTRSNPKYQKDSTEKRPRATQSKRGGF